MNERLNPRLPRAKKRWGQNFFTDADLLAAAIEPLELGDQDAVLEIGPGRGVLTALLLARAGAVTAFEIDPELWK